MTKDQFIQLQMFTFGVRAIVTAIEAHATRTESAQQERFDAAYHHLGFVHDCLNAIEIDED